MKKSSLVCGLLVSAAVVSGAPPGLAEDQRPMIESPHVAGFTGAALIHCHCVAATSGCKSAFFWRLAGSPTHDWWQEVHLVEGKEVDLTAACYRKRDVEKLGHGLCCPVDEKDGKPDEEMLKKFFGVSDVKPKKQPEVQVRPPG